MRILCIVVDMLLLMGINVDFEIVMKYAQDMEEDKLSYVLYLSCIGTSQEISIEPQLLIAKEFCEYLDIHKLHKFRINIDFNLMSHYMKGQSFDDVAKGRKMIENMIESYENNPDEMVSQKLIILYQAQMNLANSEDNTEKFIENAEKFLSFYQNSNSRLEETEQDENIDQITIVYCSLIDSLFMKGNMYKAIMVSEDFLKFAAKEGEETKQYHTALKNRVNLAWIQKDIMTFIDLSHKLADIANHVYGRISAEHAYGVQLVSRSFTVRMQYKEAFRELEKSFDILSQVFGSEINQESSQVLNEMAVTKGHLKEFEEAYSILDRAKEIESQLTSKNSQKYIEIQETETILDTLYQKYLESDPDADGSKHLKRKITGATLLVATLSYATFRYFRPAKA